MSAPMPSADHALATFLLTEAPDVVDDTDDAASSFEAELLEGFTDRILFRV